jgi:hypothetical protein
VQLPLLPLLPLLLLPLLLVPLVGRWHHGQTPLAKQRPVAAPGRLQTARPPPLLLPEPSC